MCTSRRRALAATAGVVILGLATVPVARSGAASLPKPSTGRVAYVEDAPPSPISVVWIEPTQDPNRVFLSVPDPSVLEDASLRIELYVGDPNGTASRVVATRSNGAVTATAQTGDATSASGWADQGAVTVRYREDGVVEVDRPKVQASRADDSLWAVVSRDKDGGRESATTPLFLADDLTLTAPDAAAPSSRAWRYEAGVPTSAVSVTPGPSVSLTANAMVFAFAAAAPQQVGDAKVTAIEDVVRVRMLGNVERTPSFEVHVDELTSVLRVLRGGTADVVPIPVPDAGPPGSAAIDPSGTEVGRSASELPLGASPGPDVSASVPRASLEASFGAKLSALSLIGVSRRVTLDDGNVLIFAGVARQTKKVVAPPPTPGTAVVDVPSTVIEGAPDDEDPIKAKLLEDRSQSLKILLIVGPIGGIVLGWWFWRWLVDSPFGDAYRARKQAQARRDELVRELGYDPDDPPRGRTPRRDDT